MLFKRTKGKSWNTHIICSLNLLFDVNKKYTDEAFALTSCTYTWYAFDLYNLKILKCTANERTIKRMYNWYQRMKKRPKDWIWLKLSKMRKRSQQSMAVYFFFFFHEHGKRGSRHRIRWMMILNPVELVDQSIRITQNRIYMYIIYTPL